MTAWMKRAIGLVGVCLSGLVLAGPLARSEVPASLKDWLPWVMHGHESALCPPPYNADDDKVCVWPSRLEVQAGAGGASFRLEVQVFGGPMSVALPGEAAHWPQDVRSAGRALPVAEAQGQPVVQLPPGRHTLEGRIPWREMPQDLRLPQGAGTVQLWVEGTVVSRAPDEAGRVWLKSTQQVAQGSDTAVIHTVRLVDDQVPLRVTTRYEIAIAGKAREIDLPAALLPGMVPEALDSALPARLQEGGALRLQGQAGHWTVELRARLMSPVQALSLPRATASTEEVWSFAAHNDVRLVSVEGLPSVDPKQVVMPDPWRALPAYRLRPGDTMKLAETRRGNPQPQPDSLKITRQIWLDFDGQGSTVRDEITGTLSRSTRLEMQAPGVLGRASVDDTDQPITRLKAGAPEGIEVRGGAARITADSRIQGDVRTLPATGWRADVNQASAVLNLPPGWRLLHARGVDVAQGSWLSQWTLWDFFFVLLSALAAGRLLGWKAGAVLGVALVLTWHMPGAPHALWLVLLGLHALAKVLPEGRLLNLALWSEWACVALIAMVMLPYAVDQVRLSMYPALERPWQSMAQERERPSPEEAPAPAAPQAEGGAADVAVSSERYSMGSLSRPVAPAPAARKAAPRADELDPGAKVQTGPGLPRWQWNTHRLSWQGPVQQDQTLQLLLLPPWGTVLLRLSGLALLVLALLGAWRGLPKPPRWSRASAPAPTPGPEGVSTAVAGVLLCLLLSVSGVQPVLAAEASAPTPTVPSPEAPPPSVLEALREKLTAPADCLPACADVPRMLVLASGARVQLRLEVHTLADVSVPLPGQGSHWRPSAVWVDGQSAVLRRDESGALWVSLSRGVSQVVLEADVGSASNVDISLPMPVRAVTAQTEGWTLSGLDAQGLATGAVSLSRQQAAVRQADDQGTQRDALPPFVQVERTLHLGLRWTIETRVSRAAPSLAPVRVRVPLMAGESVNDAAVQVSQGVATVQLGAEESLVFVSTLREAPRLQLRSSTEPHQIEVWKLDASTQWHASHTGIAPVLHQEGGRWMPTWQPWPGEQVVIDVVRPVGVAGQTFTVDKVNTSVSPGVRATDVSALVSLRSSQGGNHRFDLPQGATLLSVSVDGQVLPIQAQGSVVMVPITPGAREVKIDWREARGMGWWFQTSALGVGTSGVNDALSLNLPADRVVLALGGPSVGPAVLFWGVLLVIVAVGVGLGRQRFSPLNALSWVMLGLGVSQASLIGLALIVGWFLALEARRRLSAGWGRRAFMVLQVLLALWGLAAVGVLFDTVRVGLLGYPDLMIIGNGSDASHLHWFADRFDPQTAQAWVLSAPMMVYRVLMLLWALWLATSLLRWIKWAWECFSAGGYWPDSDKPIPP